MLKSKKSATPTSGYPVAFLDALSLALAAMILLMFTNLSALQSKEPPPERFHLLAKVCFSEVDLGRTLWNVRWKYRSNTILTTRTEANLEKVVTFWKEAPFPEHRLFSKPLQRKTKFGESILRLFAMAEVREDENQSILCYSLDLAFPVDEEPILAFEIERAAPLPPEKTSQIERDPQEQDRSCWKKAVILEEKTETGKLFSRVYPLPYVIDMTAYTTGANREFSFKTSNWAVSEKGADCRLKKVIFTLRLADQKLVLKQTEVKK